MRLDAGTIQLSAADLSNHLACAHLTALDLAAAEGRLEAPYHHSAELDALVERGLQHERAYLVHLESQGLRVARLESQVSADYTLAAMRDGAEVIVQAPLGGRAWFGRADVLRRVERSSELGAWSYEAYDTKLARETRGGTILQLCLYSDLLGQLQGRVPDQLHVVPPGTGFVPDSFPLVEYMAYYRLARRRLEEALARSADCEACPDPVPHCEVCRWWTRCDARRRQDDHLSFVAGITRLHMRELSAREIPTLATLAEHPIPLAWKPERGTADGFVRVREQARVQLEARTRGEPVHERLPLEPGRGLARLPAPSPSDVFLDLEGDPFAAGGGLEYLFGLTTEAEHWYAWAFDRAQERGAFERLVDTVMERWARHPDLHVYHFAPYEPAALKRLMGRYATRESEIDRMLRARLFVDLHAVVRQALRAGVERYSLKDLEIFHGFVRDEDLARSRANRHHVERAIESGSADALTDAVHRSVLDYNREDCVSAMKLRDWLEWLRAEVEADGTPVPRPVPEDGDPSPADGERDARVSELTERLTRDVPDDVSARSDEQQARWLLAHMLDWHRREEKVAWWEYFRLCEMDDEDLLEERAAIAGLEFVGREGGKDRYPIHRYCFARQETSIREEDELQARGMEKIGTVVAIDVAGQTVDIKKTARACDLHPRSVFTADVFTNKSAGESLLRLGVWVAEHGVDSAGPRRAARDLLVARAPRFAAGATLTPVPGEDVVAHARRLATRLDCCVLPIQGPPGSGKTFTGAHMLVELVRAGRRVGVSATSHKVIRNLLETALRVAGHEGVALDCVHKVSKEQETPPPSGIVETRDNDEALAMVTGTPPKVLGGTSFMWSREQFFEAVDVLIVDEAGQMSLADVLAIAHAASSVVLLGDPQQLDQPVQGSHPPGTEISALEHLLGGARTVAADRGLFLAETRRLAPALCAFTSEVFYDGRLEPLPGLERQVIAGETRFAGAGLWFVPVNHEGNRNSSPEEVEAVGELVHELASGRVSHVSEKGVEAVLGYEDILVVAPYNAQVADLRKHLPGMRVGTVDKFQGQEAAVVIYSLTTSSPEDAPRGMEFLYDLNRLNVATSRARCACILVGSRRIFEPECKTPRQMQLANALCRFLELAREVPGATAAPVRAEALAAGPG